MHKIVAFVLIFLILGPARASFSDDVSIVEVAQREYIFTDYKKDKFIQTYGVYTCVALIIYDKKLSRASLAHFDGATNIEQAITWMLRDYKNLENIEISLFGGQTPFRLERELVEALSEHGLSPKYIERNTSKNESKSIVLDVKTGVIHKYVETISSTSWNISSEKVNRLKFGRSIYRHEKSIGGGDIVDVIEETNIYNFLL